MTSEAVTWDADKHLLNSLGMDPVRVENALGSGTPDVNYAHGWVERKWVDHWPAREATPVPVEFKRGQVPFLTRRWTAGGLCWVWVRVAGALYVFDGFASQQLDYGLPKQVFVAEALWPHPGGYLNEAASYKHLGALLDGKTAVMEPAWRARWRRAQCMKTAAQVVADIGWPTQRLRAAEAGSADTDDLLAYWEN